MSSITTQQVNIVPLSTTNVYDFDTFVTEEPSLLYYDVFIDVFIDGINKNVVTRVQASSFKEALIAGVTDELHNELDVQSIVNNILDAKKLPLNHQFEDGGIALYSVVNIIRLQKFPITYPILMADNTFLVKYVLIPDAPPSMYNDSYYFAK